jgi:hypothetical protein
MILESDMTHEDMQRVVREGQTCAVCGGGLSVAWSAQNNCYCLRCTRDIEHKFKLRKRKGENVNAN